MNASEKPLVSIIMPFFNTPPAFMVEAIESVLAQEYGHWELLIVNDGSTRQESVDVARSYAARDHRIHYLEHANGANRGPSASRQLAFHRSTGTFIAILDADDLWLPRKIVEQVALLEANPVAGAVYGNTLYWFSWNKGTAGDYQPPLGIKSNTIFRPPQLLILSITGKVAIPCTCSIIVRREALQASGGFEENFMGIYEDQSFYAKLFLRTTVLVANNCWDFYRQHPESATSRLDSKAELFRLHLQYLNWLARYLQTQEVSDQAVWQAVQRMRWQYQQPDWLPRSDHAYHASRYLKKWLLRLEETVLPASFRRRIWAGAVKGT